MQIFTGKLTKVGLFILFLINPANPEKIKDTFVGYKSKKDV